jgi:gas vesicle protein
MSDHDDFGAFLIGFIVGGVAGAVAALLLAPQSGEETRGLIRDKSIELRDKAALQAEALQARAGEMASTVQERGKEIYSDVQSRSKDLVESAKKAVSRKRPAEAE